MVSGALALALVAPAEAMAWRADSDKVGGTRLSEGEVKRASAPNIDASAGILVTSDGRALWSRRGAKPRAMASTTKIMTALLVVEKGGLNKKVRVSKAASKVPYGIGLHAGEKIKVRKLLQLALVASSNDAAYALGEYVSGSNTAFVKKMNERARELGLEETPYANAHALAAPPHNTSPTDIAV
jgi:D-alanyl-D-alanine carboxypeptidase (penicillin-binding protein 5/6)